jgi:5-formyltetrahydrofolate cyclo-ligase
MSSNQLPNASFAVAKTAIRTEIKSRLKPLTEEDVTQSSNRVLEALFSNQEYIRCSNICLYLSMPSSEIQTYTAIRHTLSGGKRVFIPKVTGKSAQDLVMFELGSYDTIDTFPRSKWGIPEPPLEIALAAPDMTTSGQIDLVVVPGVAFDPQCGRVGHGKGYYGRCSKDS